MLATLGAPYEQWLRERVSVFAQVPSSGGCPSLMRLASSSACTSYHMALRTAKVAARGEFERFKTTNGCDSTAQHPAWLGEPDKGP